MTSRRLTYRHAAREDLRRLAQYIIRSSGMPRTAHDYIDRIEARCRALCDFPHVGHDRSDLGVGIRLLPFETVAIAFEVTETVVRVRRIFGQAQDYERFLKRLGS